MHITIRTYEDCENVHGLVATVQNDLLPTLRDMDGFREYRIINCGDGTISSISMFDTAEQAANANTEVAKMVEEKLAEFLPEEPEISTGEVVFESRR